MDERKPLHLPTFGRRFWPPVLLGLLGIGSLALQLHRELPRQLAAGVLPSDLAALPPVQLLALSLLNPALLLLLAGVLGAALAHRVGLVSWSAGTASRPTGREVGAAVLAGLLLSALLWGLDLVFSGSAGLDAQALAQRVPGAGARLMAGVLYGGLTEEVMSRWGVLSLLAWALHRVLRRGPAPPGAGVLWTANVAAALLFAAGHLPALAAATEPTAAWIARTLLLNALAGLVYGWIFLRGRLESAMAAHAATHLGFWLLGLAAAAAA
ncbi:CPBP family intramembrane glutamic endopeptidase [Ramlibacter sp. AN1015]|uniref:CPBP family intramembrane glutamic endopeptidase n=1 Tax=Ramlibacter sp. AN1015 TaxID=3133428 RepID=UPI0030C55A37